MASKHSKAERTVSRRGFVTKGAVAAAVAAGADAAASTTERHDGNIKLPSEVPASLAEDSKPPDFPMTGAQIFAKACKAEGLAALFCAPGNYVVINAIASEGIPSYGGRTEGMMCAAADGFARVTGEVVAASGTEGPGFTNMIMNIAAANSARSPLLVLASNMTLGLEDTEHGIQRVYQQPTTEGMKKYGKRLINPERVHEYAGYAFRQLKTGVPRPVHLDFPGEVARERFDSAEDLRFFYDKSKYRTESRPHPSPKEIAKAASMISKAERPIIVASAGVFYSKAWDALKAVAEKADIAVVESGPSRGHFGDEHPLSANAAPDALLSADLVVLVGQYCMPNIGEYSFDPDVAYIRIDPDAADIGRNLPIDLGIVSCEKAALEALAEALPKKKRPAWRDELAAARAAFEAENDEHYKLGLKYSAQAGCVHPAVIAAEIENLLYKGDIPKEQTTVVSGGYGVGRYTRRRLRAFRPGQICNGAYQYGAIGPDVGYTVGAGAAVQQGTGPQAPYKGAPVLAVTGDAGFAYSGMEMETLSKYRIPTIMVVYNNNAWGVWRSGASGGRSETARAQHMYLFQENLRYEKIGEALGARGEYVTKAEDLAPALARSYKAAADERLSTVINCQAIKEFWSARDYPPGLLQKVEPGCMAYYH
ncbi:MAG: thiamine pyrophosphate-binding protein [Acidobacteriia bacterium]|nr:thiamine pyrophosphate-binding protein [Terriglobia bacterium]MYG04984.1 thiamine pyrophosphate-binding protein [Terriglobia bacterium]MYK11210.1 thiamine pyrophosphate-binding protein [Terriglobia bacterium]